MQVMAQKTKEAEITEQDSLLLVSFFFSPRPSPVRFPCDFRFRWFGAGHRIGSPDRGFSAEVFGRFFAVDLIARVVYWGLQ